ncbi:MAG: putative rane protein, partial [Acidobacteria bacterium]|nr:putative rane protein [Acidobacteriota bacterium]
MSPDQAAERIVSSAIASAVRRARLLAIAEAVGCGFAAAALSVLAGALVALGVAAWRWRAASRGSIIRTLERTGPDAGNLFVTADEIARDALTVKPLVRARVFADAASTVQRVDVGAVLPIAPVVRAALLAAAAWAVVGAAHLWRGPVSRTASTIAARSASPAAAATASRLQVRVAVQPPPYTGITQTTMVDPEQLQVIEGSVLLLSIDASASRVSVDHDGRVEALARGGDGRFADRLAVTRTGYVLVTTDEAARRAIPVVVSPDALPAVRLTAPGRDLVYAGGNPRIVFDARATDDYGLRSLVLRYTKVTGSGENYAFKEGEIPLTVTPASGRDWSGTASRSLAELDLADGDMLVYRAVAADARPGNGTATSDAFFIEMSKLGVAAGDAFTLPEQESKYALSQQMLIVKTERLHQRRAALAAGEFTEQALNLAVEQRMIRAEFVFMLGGEIDDEEVEAEQSVELQAGRLQNRGQRDLRAATIAMSGAQKLLTAADTAAALIAERAAVTALQRAFSRDRYILRAMATRSQLDPARRLTGALGDAAGWRRIVPDVPANRRTALLQDLLRGIADLMARADGFRERALVSAEEALRIDASSASLREAAAELQRAAAAS